jgi:hypothetical protein
MGLIDAGASARPDRYIGYYRPYATSHDELDADEALCEEVCNVARAVAAAVGTHARAVCPGPIRDCEIHGRSEGGWPRIAAEVGYWRGMLPYGAGAGVP